jgi:hypothetical protein
MMCCVVNTRMPRSSTTCLIHCPNNRRTARFTAGMWDALSAMDVSSPSSYDLEPALAFIQAGRTSIDVTGVDLVRAVDVRCVGPDRRTETQTVHVGSHVGDLQGCKPLLQVWAEGVRSRSTSWASPDGRTLSMWSWRFGGRSTRRLRYPDDPFDYWRTTDKARTCKGTRLPADHGIAGRRSARRSMYMPPGWPFPTMPCG